MKPDFELNPPRRSDPLSITLTPPPDLTITEMTTPLTGNSSQKITIGWTVENQGPGAPFERAWQDQVYLSESSTFNPDSAVALGSVSKSVQLSPGSNYSVLKDFRLPDGIFGEYYIFVFIMSS